MRPLICSLVVLVAIASLAPAQDAAAARTANIAAIRKTLDTETPSLLAIYKLIHAQPELAFQEEQTAARLARELKQCGFEVTEKVGGTGVVGVLKNGPGPVIMVRADMDALPIVEQTGVSYESKVRTRDKEGREVGVMHACGHDMNVACLIGTARVLSNMKDRWQGTLVFIGQPAEEIGAGARAMLDDGFMKRFPRPDFGLALHCDSRFPIGHVNYREGQLQANVDSIDIVVRGKGGHGAAPHTTIDPIVLAARIVLDLQTIVSRERNPIEPTVVTVGSIHGGTKHNIIPSEVTLQLTVRTANDKARKEVIESIVRIAKAVAQGARAPEPIIRHEEAAFTPALNNEPELARKIVGLFRTILSPDRVHERPPSMGGEDFSQFTRAGIRTFYYFLGTVDPEIHAASKRPGGAPLPATHAPFYAPVPEPTLRTGVLSMSMAILELMNEKSK